MFKFDVFCYLTKIKTRFLVSTLNILISNLTYIQIILLNLVLDLRFYSCNSTGNSKWLCQTQYD